MSAVVAAWRRAPHTNWRPASLLLLLLLLLLLSLPLLLPPLLLLLLVGGEPCAAGTPAQRAACLDAFKQLTHNASTSELSYADCALAAAAAHAAAAPVPCSGEVRAKHSCCIESNLVEMGRCVCEATLKVDAQLRTLCSNSSTALRYTSASSSSCHCCSQYGPAITSNIHRRVGQSLQHEA
jgi:hypothetical protein